MRNYIRTAILAALLIMVAPLVAHAANGLDFSVTPDVIQIDALYDGMSLHLKGAVPADSDVVVRFRSENGEEHLKRKGKAMGLLWMNMGSLTAHDAPGVYLVTANKPLDQLGAYAGEAGLHGVAKEVRFEPEDQDTDANREEFVTLKAASGLYSELPPMVRMGGVQGDMQAFEADIDLPSRLSTGTYSVQVLALKDGAPAATAEQEIKAELVGFPSMLSHLAFENGTLYGIMATIIALIAGLVIGLVFQSKGGAH